MKRPLSFLLLLHACILPAAAQPSIAITPVITGLNQPMQLVHAGDGSKRIFIVQKTGTIRVFDSNYVSLGNFLTVSNITTTGERGLLSMAFHPDYGNNGFFYVYYTNSLGNLELARYRVSSNPNLADAASKDTLITIPHPTYSNHNGGELHFDAAGYLYLSTGDGGSGGDPNNNAQNTASRLGKLLRFAVDTTETAPFYSIPAGNPFGNEIYAVGLRNPFRWSFDRLNGDLWIGDVGQDSWEEINHLPAGSGQGANFGWRCYEGNNSFNSSGCAAASAYTFPALTYATPNPSGSITGGTVYRGDSFPELKGYYLGADYYTGRWFKIRYDADANRYDTSSQLISPAHISDFGETEDGELYITNLNNGTLYRVGVQYIFTGDGNWDVASNWQNRQRPPTVLPKGGSIAIRPIDSGECVLNVQQSVPASTSIIVEANRRFRIVDNLVIQQ